MVFNEPIDETAPAGVDCKYEDDYLEIEIEVEKFFNAASETEADWDFILTRCEKMLKERTKDLKIASFWLFARWKRGGWGEFFGAFESFVSFMETFDEEMFPRPAHRRDKILDWVEQLFEEPLGKDLEQFSQEQLETLAGLIEKLNTLFSEPPGRKSPLFKEIESRARYLLDATKQQELEAIREAERYRQEEEKRREQEQLQAKESEEKRKEVEETLRKFRTAASGTQPRERSTSSDTVEPLSKEALDGMRHAYLELAQKLLDESPADHRAYEPLFLLGERTLREVLAGSSGEEENLVPSDAIQTAARELCDMQEISSGQLSAVAEQLLAKPAWLEGYHILSRLFYKIDRTGEAEYMEEKLLYLIHRNKDVLELQIDSRPFIPEKMAAWVEAKLLSLCGESGAHIEYRMVYQEVIGVLKEQGAQNAFALLEEHFKRASSEEERFRWRLLFVDFALEIGDKRLALALLLELEKLIERFSVDRWQPDLAIFTYETLLRPIISQQLSNEVKDRIYHKLSILDAQKVISLQ